MDRKQWRLKIKRACDKAGTYRDYFLPVIETLSGILEKRDAAQQLYDEGGGVLTTEHTNKGGATNVEVAPLVRLINDLNRDALQYWRDLGLTPAGLKKINDSMAKKVEEQSELAKALEKLGG